MGCQYAVRGMFEGDFSQTTANEMLAVSEQDGIYGDAFDIDAEGNVHIYGEMGYGNACAIDEFLKEQALKWCLTGRFETDCDGETGAFYVGTPEQQRDAELEHLNAQMVEMQERMNELNAMAF